MKGRFSSEVKHKVQKLLIRDLKPEDQGRYACRYQHLESSADLWVEGLYLETVLQPSRRGGCSARLLTSFEFPHQTLRLMVKIWILPSFFFFLWDLSLCVNIPHASHLSWVTLQTCLPLSSSSSLSTSSSSPSSLCSQIHLDSNPLPP